MVLSVAAVMLATITTSSTQSLGSIEFEDVTEKLGLTLHLKGWGLGHGAAWGDLTGNDRPDLYIGAFASHGMYDGVDVPLPNMLFLNGEEGFELSPDELVRYDRRGRPRAERPRVGMALFVDLNNSGKLDLFVGTHSGPASRLFENRHPEPFRDVTPSPNGWPDHFDPDTDDGRLGGFHMRNATVIDLDQDGLLDLILIDGRYRGTEQRVRALRNLGEFKFKDVSDEYFPRLPDRTRGLGTAVGDVNHNGRLDLFVAHANRLFVSQDDGTYVEHLPGFFHIPNLQGDEWPCGAAFADLTGNGWLDLVVTVHGESRRDAFPGHVFLYINRGLDEQGMPRFEELTAQAGLDITLPHFGTSELVLKAADLALVDLNNNGRRDILMGMILEDKQGRVQPVVFRNLGVNDAGVPQFHVPPVESIITYYATAPTADYDRDGRIDVFLASPWLSQIDSYLFRNISDAGNYLVVRVAGKAANLNPMGVGATVRLYATGHAGDPAYLLGRGDIALANGYTVGGEALAHFGLGEHVACDVVIHWQGYEVVLRDVPANQSLTVPVGER